MNTSAITIATVIAANFVVSAYANDSKQEIVWLDYPAGGVVLGQGYNLLEDRPTYGTCVTFVPIQDPSQEVNYTFEEVNSRTELLSSTSISASGSLKMALVKATARLNFLSSETFTSKTTKFYLKAEVSNSTLFTSPSLDYKKGATVPNLVGDGKVENDRYKNFSSIDIPSIYKINPSRCGQGFVAAIVSGAAIDAFLTMSDDSASAIADISAGLEADIGGIFKVSGSFQQRQEAKKFQDSIKISSYQYGGSTVDIAFDLAKLKANISVLAEKAAQQPKPVRIGIVRYDSLDKAPPPAGYAAQYLADAIASYFLVTDVFSNTTGYIGDFLASSAAPAKRAHGNRPIFRATVRKNETSAEDISRYVTLNADAMATAGELSSILQLCQDELTVVNNSISGQSDNSADNSEAERESRRAQYEEVLGPADSSSTRLEKLTLNSVPSGRDSSEARYNRDLALLRLVAARTERNAKADKTRLEVCATAKTATSQVDSEQTTIRSAPGLAAQIAAAELAIRPIYWRDIGERYKHNITTLYELAEKKDGTNVLLNEAAFQAKILEELEEFNTIYRAGAMQRSVCKFAFEHPLCRIATDEFASKAKISQHNEDGGSVNEFIDVEQIRIEIENDKAKSQAPAPGGN